MYYEVLVLVTSFVLLMAMEIDKLSQKQLYYKTRVYKIVSYVVATLLASTFAIIFTKTTILLFIMMFVIYASFALAVTVMLEFKKGHIFKALLYGILGIIVFVFLESSAIPSMPLLTLGVQLCIELVALFAYMFLDSVITKKMEG